MLRFEKMTVKAQEALQSANEVAARHENQQIEPAAFAGGAGGASGRSGALRCWRGLGIRSEAIVAGN